MHEAPARFFDRSSFRDPDGRVVFYGTAVYRAVRADRLDAIDHLTAQGVIRQCQAAGQLVGSERLTARPAGVSAGVQALDEGVWFEHEALAPVTYPGEWSPRMLHAAAKLTLDLADLALAHGCALKDATPFNVVFRGPRPVFVDLTSFERRNLHDGVWRAQAQFVSTCLLPLLLHRECGRSLQDVFLTAPDGVTPEDAYAALSWAGRLRPPALTLASVPTWLAGRAESTSGLYTPTRMNPDKALFVLESLAARMRRALQSLAPRTDARSSWSDYSTEHGEAYRQAKSQRLREALDRYAPARVLDLGCNTGDVSQIAANAGASVMAIDSDPVVIDTVWQRADAQGLDILPCVANIAAPPGGAGWRNRERPSLLDRLTGRFDMVLALALVHHLSVTERVPLGDIFDLLATLTTDLAIVEYVDPSDPLFVRLARGRDHLHRDITPEAFVASASRHFSVVEQHAVDHPCRRLFVLRRLPS